MNHIIQYWNLNASPSIRARWSQHQKRILWAAVVFMILAAMHRLGYGFHRLLVDSGQFSAIDLWIRFEEVGRWFSGKPFYEGWLKSAGYPPASYVIEWPLVGWLRYDSTRFLWGGTSLVVLSWLSCLMVSESGAKTRLERVFIFLLPLSMYATNIIIGNGQLIIYVLPIMLTALFLRQQMGGWFQDVLLSTLFVIALVKPQIVAPFFWLIIFIPPIKLRNAVLVVVGYISLMVFAMSFQPGSVLSLTKSWLDHLPLVYIYVGYGNLHNLLHAFQWDQFYMLSSSIVILALGAWVYVHRKVDLWLLIGVIAVDIHPGP